MADFPSFEQGETGQADEIAAVFSLDPAPASPPAAAPAAGEEVAAPTPPAAATPSEPATAAPQTPAEPAPATPPVAAPVAPTAATPSPATPLPGVAPATPPAAPAAPAAAAPAGEEALRWASMEAQLRAAQDELARMRAAPASQQQPAGTPAATPSSAAPGAEPPVQYGLTMPDELTNAIFGEDPAAAKAGMTRLVNSLAENIHNRLQQQFRTEMGQRFEGIAEERRAASEADGIRRMQEDYYGAFPQHNNPVIKQIVALEASKLGTEYPNAPWDDNYRNTLGARVNAALAGLGASPSAAPAHVPATSVPAAPVPPVPPARPAAFAPAAPRTAPSFTESQGDVIADTFSFGTG